jgi:hypothetical protein
MLERVVDHVAQPAAVDQLVGQPQAHGVLKASILACRSANRARERHRPLVGPDDRHALTAHRWW